MDLRKAREMTLVLVMGICLSTIPVNAANGSLESGQSGSLPGLVEVVYPVEILLPYKERRPSSQFTFHFQYESLKPTQLSFANQGDHESVFASAAAPILGINLGMKFNIPLMGFDLSLGYGSGGLGGGINGTSYNLQRKSARAMVILDGITSEPYLAPYAAVSAASWDFREISSVGSNSATLSPTMSTQFGALVQLNWLEPDAALKALSDAGLQNTYLDVFLQQVSSPTVSGVTLASAMNWGLGFRMEY